MTLSDPHPVEAAVRSTNLRRQVDELPAAADWLREVACLLWDNTPPCEQCHGDKTVFAGPNGHATHLQQCPSCHGSGKPDPAEHLRGMIARDRAARAVDASLRRMGEIGGTP